jgi:hypothetical protein
MTSASPDQIATERTIPVEAEIVVEGSSHDLSPLKIIQVIKILKLIITMEIILMVNQ